MIADGVLERISNMRKERYSERVSKQPEIVIFAGPNGSGKSTFTQLPFRNYVPTKNGFMNIHCRQQANIL